MRSKVLLATSALFAASLIGCGGDDNGQTPAPPAKSNEIPTSISSDLTLTSDQDWILKGIVHVRAGATLTIEPGTTIKGDKSTLGTLVVDPGARIHAEGTKDEPIVFTSRAEPGDRAAGDWGGVILLGKAPINVPGGKANVEGIEATAETEYGGDNPADDSGVLKYVRIEFGGILLSTDNEINGLTLAGVGSGTTIDYVQVRYTLDDCFEFFGGTVNAKHLVCTYNQDDGIDWDLGYTGKLQFVVVQQDPAAVDDTNGFEGDNDAMGTTNAPLSEPTIYNATLVGKNVDVDKQQYAMLLRRATKASLFNIVATGFEAGVDVRDAATSVKLEGSIFHGNLAQNVAYVETPEGEGSEKDDDMGFDEVKWFEDGGNVEVDPLLVAPYDREAPDFRPKATLTTGAAKPPSDGFFDTKASYVGAFSQDDTWLDGAWISFSPN
ncbi:hypothetical protein [Polyangium sp. y55x31]|uniref:hypothetical protein n=1 Tax=Polyangium sp. y55x31 TaxID=3042688 RepID=UPI002482BC36|nr:hypothetical protein [Polyangium sp. y55x31]MDI1477869.1 hypothetical protein [Polyangium sp. y55x31]